MKSYVLLLKVKGVWRKYLLTQLPSLHIVMSKWRYYHLLRNTQYLYILGMIPKKMMTKK